MIQKLVLFLIGVAAMGGAVLRLANGAGMLSENVLYLVFVSFVAALTLALNSH